MNPFLFKDNLVLHLKNYAMKMDTKVWATGEADKFKVCTGTDALNRHYDTAFKTTYEIESIAIDGIVNGYDVITNYLFQDGIDGVVKRRIHSLTLLSKEAIGHKKENESESDDEIYQVDMTNYSKEEAKSEAI